MSTLDEARKHYEAAQDEVGKLQWRFPIDQANFQDELLHTARALTNAVLAVAGALLGGAPAILADAAAAGLVDPRLCEKCLLIRDANTHIVPTMEGYHEFVSGDLAVKMTSEETEHYQARVRELREQLKKRPVMQCGSLLEAGAFPGARCDLPFGHPGEHRTDGGYPTCQLCLMSYEMDHHHNQSIKGYHTFVGPLPL